MVSGIPSQRYLILILFDRAAKKTLCSENFHRIFVCAEVYNFESMGIVDCILGKAKNAHLTMKGYF